MGLLEWFQPFDFSTFLFNFFFNSVACDLISRHLFLLVLVFFFLLRACDFNQEMEIQKSTCCHSKYVLFRSPNKPAPGPAPSRFRSQSPDTTFPHRLMHGFTCRSCPGVWLLTDSFSGVRVCSLGCTASELLSFFFYRWVHKRFFSELHLIVKDNKIKWMWFSVANWAPSLWCNTIPEKLCMAFILQFYSKLNVRICWCYR